MPCKEEEDEVSGSTFGGMPKVMFFGLDKRTKEHILGVMSVVYVADSRLPDGFL